MAEEVKKSETLNLFICPKSSIYCSYLSCICCGRVFSHRLTLSLLLIYGCILAFTQRACLSLAITEMTIPQNHSKKVSVDPEACKSGSSLDRPVIWDIQGGKFDWDEKTQSYILMSFYIGYMLCNIPAGYLCDYFGAKWILCGGMLISTVGTLMIPLVAIYTSWHYIVVLRAVMGLGQSPLVPATTLLTSRWIPPAERTLVGGVILSSLSLGTILGTIPTAFILRYGKSWVWVFYLYGILGAIFCTLFGIFAYSAPQVHPFLTPEENEYLSTRIPTTTKRKVPILSILSDLTVWSCLICQISNDYTLFTYITNLPKYLTDVLKFSSQEAGFLVCIPQMSLFLGSFLFGALTDALIFHRGVKTVTMRVTNTFLATVIPAFALLACCMFRCERILAVLAISIGLFFKSMFYTGMKLTFIDITYHHAGLVAAIVNTAGGISGVAAPYTIGQIATENTFKQWDLITYITMVISIVSVIPYMLFNKAERKPWDYEPGSEPPPEPDAKTGCITVLSCVNKH